MNAIVFEDAIQQPAAKPPRRPLNPGFVFSVVFHVGVVLYVLHLVQPSPRLAEPARKQMLVELAPPPPPPPPPPPKEPPPKPVAPIRPLTPPPPQQIVTAAPEPAPEIAAVPPPVPVEPAPAPAAPTRVVATSVPEAYYNDLQAMIQDKVEYPSSSQLKSEQGACLVRVSFARNGSISEAKLVRKAGYLALDNECREVFKRIGKFPALPANANPEATDFSIELPIEFSLG
jgi:protein TonB